MTKNGLRRAGCMAALSGAMLLAGCGSFGDGFFQNPNNGGSTPVNPSGADYVYVVNNGNTLSEFVVGSSVLTAVSGSPVTLPTGLAAASVTVSRDDNYVFVGGDGAIEVYGIGSGGALTQETDGVSEEANFVSLDTSPDGKWLFALDNLNNEVWIFGINSSSGALTLQGSQLAVNVNGLVLATAAPARMLKMAPDGGLLAVAVGTAGDEVFTFDTTTGALTAASAVDAPASGFSDDSVAFDGTSSVPATHLLIGRGITAAGSSTILSYGVTASTGALTPTASGYAVGEDPYALLVDATGTYVYSADRGANQVAGYTLSNGALTTLGSSPYTGGSEVTALAEDNGKKYVIAAAAGSSPDLTMYAFDALTAGQLDAVATTANGGTAGSIAVATTH